jgi:hypothetical protein
VASKGQQIGNNGIIDTITKNNKSYILINNTNNIIQQLAGQSTPCPAQEQHT